MRVKETIHLWKAAGFALLLGFSSIQAGGQSTNFQDTLSRWGVYPEYGNPEHARSNYQTPEEIVYGGEFLDRFMKMPAVGKERSNIWGAEWVLPRDAENGMEDEEYSYWGGNIVIGDDGKNHMFLCRWPEDCKKGNGKEGHACWPGSVIVHAVSENPMGPYKVIEEIGKGHNPEIYRKKDGTYVIGSMWYTAYTGPTINGPWTKIKPKFQDPEGRYANRTYAVRDDGNIIMMNKPGQIFINFAHEPTEHWTQLTTATSYKRLPADNGKSTKLEDPVIWRDEIQYHCVYHDWNSPMGLYLRSPDGITWTWMEGKAYQSNNMMNILGINEDWFTYERPKVRQDKYGRATHMNWAVCDVGPKGNDKANDEHSSKNLIAPLCLQRRYIVLNQDVINVDTKEISIKILAEDGFDPHTDIDLKSLKIGAPKTVNFGGGASYKSSTKSGRDLIVTFDGKGNGITFQNFATKLLGKTSDGKLLFGFSALRNGVPVNTLREYIVSHTLPDKISSENVAIEVSFETWNERELTVSLYNKSTGKTETGLTRTVIGRDTVRLDFTGFNRLSLNDSYQWIIKLLPVGGNPDEYIGRSIKKDIILSFITAIDNE